MARFNSPGRNQYKSYKIPQGISGIKNFQIPKMAEYVREFCTHPDIVVFSRNLVLSCPPKDIICEVETIHDFVCQHFRFVDDPVDREVISTPLRLLDEIQRNGRTSADCDEVSVLECSLLSAIGIVTRFAFGGENGEIYHVWPQALIYDEWEDLEPSGYLEPGQHYGFGYYEHLEIFDL